MKKVLYVSDQKYYVSKSKEWYTTSSFPKGLANVFEGLKEWTFFGRLYEVEDVNNLFKINFDKENIKVKFEGVWESPPGLRGYIKNFFYYLRVLKKNIDSNDVIYLKFSFISSYLSGLVSNFENKFLITHMVGDIECIRLVNTNLFVDILVKIENILYRYIVKKADVQLYVSENLKSKYIVGMSRAEVICENRFREEDIISPQRIKSRSSEESLKLLYVGRLSPEKGLIDVIKALKKTDDVTLDVIGRGDYLTTLKNAINENGLNERVKFLGYIRWGEELFRRFENYHYLILPSYSEGLPLVIIEAMSMGLPVIASNVGGIPEVITNRKNGLLFPPGDITSIVDTINLAKFDEELRKKIILNGMETAYKYSSERQLDKFKIILKSLGE